MVEKKVEVKESEAPAPAAKPQVEQRGVGPSDVTARRVQEEAIRQKKVVRGK